MSHINKNNRISRMSETVSTIAVLAIALNTMTLESFSSTQSYLMTAMSGFLLISYIAKFFNIKDKSKYDRILCGFKIAVSLSNVIISIVMSGSDQLLPVMFYVYISSMIVSRIFSVFKHFKIKNILINLLFTALFTKLISMMITASVTDFGIVKKDISAAEVWLIGVTVSIHMILRVISMSFSKIRLDILKKIASRSMALEILSGLIILIIAFSFVLKTAEPQMTTLSDALWYCFVLITTIGFGDITATTAIGRIISVILGIYGIIVVALITSIIVNFYTELKNEEEAKATKLSDEKQSENEDKEKQVKNE